MLNTQKHDVIEDQENREEIVKKPQEFIEKKDFHRKIEKIPLISPKTDSSAPPVIDEDQLPAPSIAERKKMNEKRNDIKSLAQQLQSQREKEDEMLNPNAISKLSIPT
jgi:hypothetical protein